MNAHKRVCDARKGKKACEPVCEKEYDDNDDVESDEEADVQQVPSNERNIFYTINAVYNT